MDSCLLCGLWWRTHVSPTVIIFYKFSGFALRTSKFSSLNCWRHAFCSGVNIRGTNRELTKDIINGEFSDTPRIPAVYQISEDSKHWIFFSWQKKVRFLNVSPTNQLRKCWQTTLLRYCIIFVGLAVSRNLMRWMHGIARALRHRKKERYPCSHSSSLPWFFTSGTKGECSLKQSAGTAKYCDELAFLRVTRTEFCWILKFPY